jgi:hypothetical protein
MVSTVTAIITVYYYVSSSDWYCFHVLLFIHLCACSDALRECYFICDAGDIVLSLVLLVQL